MLEYSNFLNIQPLFQLSCAYIASMFKGKNFDSVKKELGLESEVYTPQDDDEILEKFPWILEETENKLK